MFWFGVLCVSKMSNNKPSFKQKERLIELVGENQHLQNGKFSNIH